MYFALVNLTLYKTLNWISYDYKYTGNYKVALHCNGNYLHVNIIVTYVVDVRCLFHKRRPLLKYRQCVRNC